jgi:hypothetical protein
MSYRAFEQIRALAALANLGKRGLPPGFLWLLLNRHLAAALNRYKKALRPIGRLTFLCCRSVGWREEK